MCITPSFIWVQRGPKFEQQPVACRQCWRCKQNRVNDYVARCLAEASVSEVSATISLTYAPRDDLADKMLLPRHFQLFMKLLRRAGHKVRYLVAGEYGELRGRAHFHAMLFFSHFEPLQDKPVYNWGHMNDPSTSGRFSRQIPNMEMVHIREWPHGHVLVDWSANEKSAKYVCKYLLKAEVGNRWFSLSKKPALGHVFFMKKAAIAKALGVLPSSFSYLPPGGNAKRPYLLTGASRRDYLNAITTHPADKSRMSEWVLKTFEKHERQRLIDYLENQPFEVIEEAYDMLRDTQAQQERNRDSGDFWRQTERFDKMMRESRRVLRKYDGRWQPERD